MADNFDQSRSDRPNRDLGWNLAPGDADGGESTLSGYSREYPTRPEKFEEMGRRAPGVQGEAAADKPEIGEVTDPPEPTEDQIDEAIEESFPASDPPSYMGSTN